MLVIPLIYRAAELCGVEPETVFDKASALVGDTCAQELSRFLERRNKDIETMGYVEGADKHGFRFVRTW